VDDATMAVTHVLRAQAHLLVQFPVHGLFGGFPLLDATLGELPGMLLDALPPEHLVPGVAQDDADVWPVAVAVYHDYLP
jgi:hypothetical protein